MRAFDCVNLVELFRFLQIFYENLSLEITFPIKEETILSQFMYLLIECPKYLRMKEKQKLGIDTIKYYT